MNFTPNTAVEAPPPSRLAWMDVGRCIAVFAVIAIHGGGIFMNDLSSPAFYLAHFLNGFSRFCVPIFFMFSGYLLCGKPIRHPGPYVRRKIGRLVAAYIFAAVVYFLYYRFYEHADMLKRLPLFFAGAADFHLWFIPALASTFFFLPLFARLTEEDKGYVFAFICAAFLLQAAAQSFSNFTGGPLLWGIETGFGVPYFLLGFCVSSVIKLRRRSCLLVFVLASVVISGAKIVSTRTGYSFPGAYAEGFFGIPVLIQSIAFFLLIKDLSLSPNVAKVVSKIADLVFGIYILHHLFLIFTIDALNHLGRFNNIIMLIVSMISAFALSAACTFALKKVHWMAKIL
jgi:surface polysaccharide O-acyltransferase-like enzyme